MSSNLELAKNHFNNGMRYFQNSNWNEAISSLKQCIDLAESVPDAHFLLGTSYIKIGSTDLAIRHLKRCVELKPNHPEANMNLGVMLGKSGNTKDADKYVAKSAFLGLPQAKQMLQNLGANYCRICGNPVKYGKYNGPADAVINIVEKEIGLVCCNCGAIICQSCLPVQQLQDARCPRCKGNIKLLT